MAVQLMAGGEQLAAIARRDPEAFTALVAEHDRALVRLCYVITGDREQARDAAQSTWQRLWRDPPRMRDASKLRSWLLRVAANEARQVARRRRRGLELERENAADSPQRPDHDELLDLAATLGRLGHQDRELLALRYVLELPSPQIAEHLGISAEGVRSRLHRLLGRLRQEMDR
ncbi:MAG TPA: sigma-70 family RNA polymerase sigma factor [Candidatus Limnocylindria bacterium]|nr:sigma-70 family RNA polymerase sigma factor [Candidatus Limnocylindria bacterium]